MSRKTVFTIVRFLVFTCIVFPIIITIVFHGAIKSSPDSFEAGRRLGKALVPFALAFGFVATFLVRGTGCALPFITGGALVIVPTLVGKKFGPNYYALNYWPKLLAWALAAGLMYLVALWAEKLHRDGIDHFFFVPIKLCAPFLMIGGVFMAVLSTDLMNKLLPPLLGKPGEQTASAPVETSPQTTESAPVPAPQPATFASVQEQIQPVTPQSVTPSAPQPSTPSPSSPKLEKVYVDQASKTYFTEKCKARPATATPLAKSVARSQGYTLAPACADAASDDPFAGVGNN